MELIIGLLLGVPLGSGVMYLMMKLKAMETQNGNEDRPEDYGSQGISD